MNTLRTARTSETLSQVAVSPLFGMLAEAARLKAAGRAIVGLTAGEPDFDTPPNIRRAAVTAMEAGQTRYTPVAGTPALKQAIQQKLFRDNRLEYSREEILATTGAKQALFNFCLAVLNPGDEVIIPAPYWPSYVDMVRLAGAKEVIVPTLSEDRFLLKALALGKAISGRTKAIFLNSPGNPSGSVYEATDWTEIARVLDEYPDILVVSDEIYEHIRFTEGSHVGLLNACPVLRDRTVLVNGVSKSYAMTGWRIGFAAGPKDIIAAMEAVQSHSTSNPCSVAQAAAVEALTGDQSFIEKMKDVFGSRHATLLGEINKVPGLRGQPAGGAFYLMVDAREMVSALARVLGREDVSDIDLVQHLLDRYDLALAAGSWFGAQGFMRISFAASEDSLGEAVRRLRAAAAELTV